MIRLLFIIAIVGVAVWWMFGRRKGGGEAVRPEAPPVDKAAAPLAMVACAHCAVHLPRDETVADADGRLFCGEAHRVAGPR
jgi:uncharacterized protein